ncbi:EAL domain-containing protein [Sulfurospirillum sp. 'SP']|nr:EAL domain-containing protein [Sulfurospirillum sp. 'SP']WNY98676.1 EAL domain-containing protein [Sulfurospirillum sp. 'SP']
MAILQKNIWTIFYILLIGAFIFLGIVSFTKWESVHEKYTTDQANLVKLVSNATHSLFLSQETTLNILGNQILKDKDPRVMDDLLILNPSIVAFGFVDLDGNYQHVSSNFNKAKLPNLRQHEATKDSFDYTMTQEKMVLGRTYFIATSGHWGIPIRKSIFDHEGKRVGVMTAGLAIEGAFKIFTENLSLGEYNKVTLIRNRDQFVQYQSSNHETPKNLYEKPLADNFLMSTLDTVMRKYHVSIDEIKQKPEIYTIETISTDDKSVQMALKYEPRYELWILSEIDHDQIVDDFIESFISYVLIFVIVHVILFLLFKIISHAEEKRSKDLIFQATHDELTKLPNRSYLQQSIQKWIYDKAPPFSLYYLDMDHFKNINDSFGHQFGDILLVEFAKRISAMVRKESVVIRQGGDEFVILTYRTDEEDILTHSQSILNEISKPYHIKQFSFVVGASIGIAKYPEHGTSLDMLLRAADIAMYEAKKYKNSVRLFAPSMQSGYLNRVNVEQALHKALDKHEFYMVYQPQVDHEGTIYGVEALVRWNSAEMGLVPPDQFIPIAEAAGVMPRLGKFILSTTLKEMKSLQTELGLSLQTSINISIKQFMETHFLDYLIQKIEQENFNRISLCLEITESLFIEDIDYILPLLQKVHELGLHISMDDFGTGYSSLSILRKLPIDELKIDKSFVDAILNDVTAEKMIQNIIAIGKNLEMYILAEGVERKEQEDLLKEYGCDRFQGYLYSKPLTYDALKEFLEQQEKKHG